MVEIRCGKMEDVEDWILSFVVYLVEYDIRWRQYENIHNKISLSKQR